jgi:hypothetical protein
MKLESSLEEVRKACNPLSQHELIFNVNVINQQINMMKKIVSPDESSPSEISPAAIRSTKSSIQAILTPSEPFKRASLHRNYKKRNYGIMTSDLVIQQCEDIESAKEIAEAAKIDRQNEREDLKRQRQVLLDVKKEKAEKRISKKRNTAPPETLELVKPKRGRPKKSAS